MSFEGKYQSVGNKGIFRAHISFALLNAFDSCDELYNSINLGINPQYIEQNYKKFIAAFRKIYGLTFVLIKNKKLSEELNSFFKKGYKHNTQLTASTKPMFVENANKSVELFSSFIIELSESGIYNPEIIFKYKIEDNAWVDSF